MRALNIIMSSITPFFVTKAFTFDEMLDYSKRTNRTPELHLKYFVEDKMDVSKVFDELVPLNISIADGGWCDFAKNQIMEISKQLNIITKLKISNIRLFFTPLCYNELSDKQIFNIVYNIQLFADAYPSTNFLFETHKGIGTHPVGVRDLMVSINRTNVGIVFDPVNIILDGNDPHKMLKETGEYIKHVHLKGYSGIELCSFGKGKLFDSLVTDLFCYTKSFSIEYEGLFNVVEELEAGYDHFRKVCK